MKHLLRAACGAALAPALLLVLAVPAAAEHVQPRAITTACPADQVGSRSEPYGDVEGSPFEREITCVSDYRIALGTGDGRYVPEGAVSRAQMARFLVRLAESARLSVPADLPTTYTDTGGLDAETQRAIEALRPLGIAYGLGQDRFGPAEPVSRGQMASFLARFLERIQVQFTNPAYAAFDDDGGSVHEDEIAFLAGIGVATGLGGEQHRRFAPGGLLTRGQMAAFLARTLDVGVEDGDLGSPYVAPETVEAPVLAYTDDPLPTDRGVLVFDEPYRQRGYDRNDVIVLGDDPASINDFAELVSVGDRIRVDYAPNFYDASTWTLLDDRVEPATRVLATVLVGDDGVQDDVRIAWEHRTSDAGVVERRRSGPGDDGFCGTPDDPAYVDDGTVEGEIGSGNVLFPQEPVRVHPVLVDEDVASTACYRYVVRAVSDAVPGSTPAEPSEPSNAVLVGGGEDTAPPQLTRADLLRERSDEQTRVVRYTFGNEAVVQRAFLVFDAAYATAGLHCYLDDTPPYDENPIDLNVFVEQAEGSSVVGTLRSERPPACDEAFVQPVAVVDEKGNPTQVPQRVPYAGMG